MLKSKRREKLLRQKNYKKRKTPRQQRLKMKMKMLNQRRILQLMIQMLFHHQKILSPRMVRINQKK